MWDLWLQLFSKDNHEKTCCITSRRKERNHSIVNTTKRYIEWINMLHPFIKERNHSNVMFAMLPFGNMKRHVKNWYIIVLNKFRISIYYLLIYFCLSFSRTGNVVHPYHSTPGHIFLVWDRNLNLIEIQICFGNLKKTLK